MPVMGSFYGLQGRAFTPNQLYKIYVADETLACAYVAGQLCDSKSAARQLQPFDSDDPSSAHFLLQDSRNIQIARADIVSVRLNRRSFLGRLYGQENAGSLTVVTTNRSKHRWILLHDQNLDEVLELLTKFWPQTEATGKARVAIKRSTYGESEILEFAAKNRVYRLEASGIRECSSSGDTVTFIDWTNIQRLELSKISQIAGPPIHINLPPPWHKTLLREAEQRLKKASYIAWKRDQLGRIVSVRRVFRLWIPVVFWALTLIAWLPLLALGFPPQGAKLLEAAKRTSIMAAVITAICWCFDFFVLRKHSVIPNEPETTSH